MFVTTCSVPESARLHGNNKTKKEVIHLPRYKQQCNNSNQAPSVTWWKRNSANVSVTFANTNESWEYFKCWTVKSNGFLRTKGIFQTKDGTEMSGWITGGGPLTEAQGRGEGDIYWRQRPYWVIRNTAFPNIQKYGDTHMYTFYHNVKRVKVRR